MGKTFSFSSCKVEKNKKIKRTNGPITMKSIKGSNTASNNKCRTLKTAPAIISPEIVSCPPHIVEFKIDGTIERVGVFEILPVLDKSHCSTQMFSPENDRNPDTPIGKGSLKGKAKRNKNSKKSGEKNRSLVDQSNETDNIANAGDDSFVNSTSQEQFNSIANDTLPLPEVKFKIIKDYYIEEAPPMPSSYIRHNESSLEDMADEIEYDLDELDCAWLELQNENRQKEKLPKVDLDKMEFLLDRFEKLAYIQMQNIGGHQTPLIDDDAVCCVCLDGECQNSNVILFCDMCNLAIHQECYGVPYIPEGQWLCRRCLQSPSTSGHGECELCPNKGGALKQTHEGKWAHVVCAIWIPEVCFANTVFLEPVDGIPNIPAARWRLTCFICKQKGIGACIQCHKSNCYKAFHVTCAQQANLVMTIDTVRHNSKTTVKKIAWCDNHAPPGSERKRKDDDESSSTRQKLNKTRKLLAEKREAVTTVTIPTIPEDKIAELATQIKLKGKKVFIKHLLAYWKLKRQSRNGVPLLRRLQISSVRPNATLKEPPVKSQENTSIDPVDTDTISTSNLSPYKKVLKIRQCLERARLLSELVRKREQLKLSDIRTREKITDLTLQPFNVLLKGIVDEIIAKDTHEFFIEPVDTEIVTKYLSVIAHPMDLGTMKQKAETYGYLTLDQLEKDFKLIISNCKKFNPKDSVYYKSALKLREVGSIIISQGRRKIESIGFDPKTGMHLPE